MTQAEAFVRTGLSGEKGALRFSLGDQTFVHLTGKGAAGRVGAECGAGRWLITTAETGVDGACTLIDVIYLRKTGALAIYDEGEGLQIVSAKEQAGVRLWNAP